MLPIIRYMSRLTKKDGFCCALLGLWILFVNFIPIMKQSSEYVQKIKAYNGN